VLDAGGGMGSSTWGHLPDTIAEVVRVCAYDRANMGFSDPAPTPRCLAEVVSDLHALLAKADVAPPYVLVGHSIGGLDIRLFGAMHPDEVAGLVLIDATPVSYLEEFAADACGEPMTPIPGEAYDQEGLHVSASDLAAIERYVPEAPARILVGGGRGPQLDEGETLDEEWMVLHADLEASWPGAELVVVEGSGHYIHNERPELVIEAIEAVVEEVRERTAD
jgi:pimeloyl-ACP methyl ester carboxylesterase